MQCKSKDSVHSNNYPPSYNVLLCVLIGSTPRCRPGRNNKPKENAGGSELCLTAPMEVNQSLFLSRALPPLCFHFLYSSISFSLSLPFCWIASWCKRQWTKIIMTKIMKTRQWGKCNKAKRKCYLVPGMAVDGVREANFWKNKSVTAKKSHLLSKISNGSHCWFEWMPAGVWGWDGCRLT